MQKTGSTFETVRGDGTEIVVVNLEFLQRWWQQRDLGKLVVIKVQFLQKSQVLHDTQQKERKENVHLCHVYLSWCIFSKATPCGSSVKVAVVDVCPVKAVDCVFCSIPLAQPLVLCHYRDESKNPLKIISFYSPHYWLQLFSNRFVLPIL